MTIERGVKRILVVLSVLLSIGSLITVAELSLSNRPGSEILVAGAVLALILVGLLWAAFFAVRWCVQGFRGPTR
jgi:hypothetical protein